MKLSVQVIFTSLAGIAGNVVAAFVVQDVWSNVFTPSRIWGTVFALAGAAIILVLLESKTLFIWNRRWHQFWYLRDLMADPRIRRWAHRFGVLDFLRKQRPLMRAEVVKDGTRMPLPLTQALKHDVLSTNLEATRVLVVGEPGSGKTTGLERLAWELASHDSRLFSRGSRVPVLVRLNTFHGSTIESFIEKTIANSTKNRSGKVLAAHYPELIAIESAIFCTLRKAC